MGGSVGAATTPRKITSAPESAEEYTVIIVENFEVKYGATDDDE